MNFVWKSYLQILPPRYRDIADKYQEALLECRLRLNKHPCWITLHGNFFNGETVNKEDLAFCLNAASSYSPWAAATSAKGYITSVAGHRLGLCGQAVTSGQKMQSLRTVTSICLRVARDFPGIGKSAAGLKGSILILGPPGSGKTTLLRDLIRQKSDFMHQCIAVVDERQELFPMDREKVVFETGKNTDILSGCNKQEGIETVIRNMTPQIVAVDEITSEEDCKALIYAGWCGVDLLATAHAVNQKDLWNRKVYRPLVECGLFSTLIILSPDKSWHVERVNICP